MQSKEAKRRVPAWKARNEAVCKATARDSAERKRQERGRPMMNLQKAFNTLPGKILKGAARVDR